MSLNPHLVTIAQTLLEAGHGLSPAELRRALPRLASRDQILEELREQDWLAPAASSGRLELNLDRPGAGALLELIEVTSGITADRYRARGGAEPLNWGTSDLQPPHRQEEPIHHSLVQRADALSLGTVPESDVEFYAQHARAERRALSQILGEPVRLEERYHNLYSQLSLERARDFIHLLGHLAQDLVGMPHAEHDQPGRELIRVAVIADHDAFVFREYGQRVSLAAHLGQERARVSEPLAQWAQVHFLQDQDEARKGIYSDQEGHGAATRRRAVTDAVADARPRLIAHGGMPHNEDLGHGGDYLLAELLLHHAQQLAQMVERIRAMGMMWQPLAGIPGQDEDAFQHAPLPQL